MTIMVADTLVDCDLDLDAKDDCCPEQRLPQILSEVVRFTKQAVSC